MKIICLYLWADSSDVYVRCLYQKLPLQTQALVWSPQDICWPATEKHINLILGACGIFPLFPQCLEDRAENNTCREEYAAAAHKVVYVSSSMNMSLLCLCLDCFFADKQSRMFSPHPTDTMQRKTMLNKVRQKTSVAWSSWFGCHSNATDKYALLV